MTVYPADFETSDGQVVLGGQIDFTDPDNQPGGGGGFTPVETSAATFDAEPGQIVLVDASGNDVEVALPVAPTPGSEVAVWLGADPGGNTVSVTSDELIDGQGEIDLTTLYAQLVVVYTGADAGWAILSQGVPGGGGLPTGAPNTTLALASSAANASFAAVVGSGEGTLSGSVSYAALTAMGDAVVDLATITAAIAGIVPSTADPFDLQLSVLVTDSLGANQASAAAGSSVASPVTDLAATLSLDGGTWDISAGTDLTADGNALITTVGGLFFVYVTFQGSWD